MISILFNFISAKVKLKLPTVLSCCFMFILDNAYAQGELEISNFTNFTSIFSSAPWKIKNTYQYLNTYTPPTIQDLLTEINLPKTTDLTKNYTDLVGFINGNLGRDEKISLESYCKKIASNKVNKFQPTANNFACLAMHTVDELRANFLDKQEKYPEYKIPKQIWKEENFVKLAGISLGNVYPLLEHALDKKSADTLKLARKFKKKCEYAGTFAALVVYFEGDLPSVEAQKNMQEFYDAATPCLQPDADGFERLHQRIGLMAFYKKKFTEAKFSLEKSLLATDKKEDYRSLFWLGMLEKLEQPSDTSPFQLQPNHYWTLLQQKYPMSFHGVLVAHLLGKDPMQNLASDAEVAIAGRLGHEWNAVNSAAFIADLLNANKEYKGLNTWTQMVVPFLDLSSSPQLLYWAKQESNSKDYLSMIKVFNKIFKVSGDGFISPQMLELFYPRVYIKEILARADTVDPVLLFALIRQESAFDPFARSRADARGLMQLIPSTANRFIPIHSSALYDPAINVQIGSMYMAKLLKNYDGKIEHTLAAYNAGPKNLERWKDRYPDANILLFSDLIPFKETRVYVSIILRNSYWYGRVLNNYSSAIEKQIVAKSKASEWQAGIVNLLLASLVRNENNLQTTQNIFTNYLTGIIGKEALVSSNNNVNTR